MRDHTGANGYFIYMETSVPARVGDTYTLTSDLLPPTQSYSYTSSGYARGACLEFWYHMYGPEIGTLNVYVNTYDQRALRWTKTGSQGNRWTKASINVNTMFDFTIMFEGVNGGWRGDIAIDDITVSTVV